MEGHAKAGPQTEVAASLATNHESRTGNTTQAEAASYLGTSEVREQLRESSGEGQVHPPAVSGSATVVGTASAGGQDSTVTSQGPDFSCS